MQVEMRPGLKPAGRKRGCSACHAKTGITHKDYIQLPLFQYMISGQAEQSHDLPASLTPYDK